MDKLFNHPGFRLIFIDDNGDMSLEGPFEDEGSRKNVQEYRCISHVWKTGDGKDHAWRDHGIANVTWKVEVREEKRERLYQIFNHHKGYFWMDVFCTNQEDENKPLDIMGDIYRNCKECVCLLDTICDIPGFTSEKDVLTDLTKDTREYMGGTKNFHEEHNRRYDTFSGGECGDYIKNLATCGWFHRVWTWQEAALPPKLLFCCEEAGQYRYDPFDQEFLKELFPYKFLEVGMAGIHGGDTDALNEMKQLIKQDGNLLNMLEHFSPIMDMDRKQNIWYNVITLSMSYRKCTEKQDYVYGVAGILNIDVPKGLALDKAIMEFDKSLYKQGVFMLGGHGFGDPDRDHIDSLEDLFRRAIAIDGIIVLGRVSNSVTLEFNPGVVQEYESHGRILSKEYYDNDMYEHICYKYVTDTSIIIYLEMDSYDIGDIIETTKIGREGRTFQHIDDDYNENEIFEMVNNRVRTIGHIGDNLYKSPYLGLLDVELEDWPSCHSGMDP